MTPNQLARWQWADYDQFHQDSGNRVIHGVAVPLVWLGTVGLLVALANGAWPKGLFTRFVPSANGVQTAPIEARDDGQTGYLA